MVPFREFFSGLILAGLLPLAGCGYRAAGPATHLPATVHVLDVPVFKNRTQAYHIELTMTQAVLKELESRTAYRLETNDAPGDADAVLRGTITGVTVYALTYDSTTNQSSSYEVTVTAQVTLTDRDGRVLYRNDHYKFRDQYESTQDLVSFIQEDSAAMRRISRDFAQNLVADMTESF
jgi:outer membrane lipopolysaccharide assembly protein LptE/RlpB